uniref:Uncharacterized protein n=1 Tax=Glossina pallidipes TaxID=7398 RepID=A0A1A9ZPP0_GLOPL
MQDTIIVLANIYAIGVSQSLLAITPFANLPRGHCCARDCSNSRYGCHQRTFVIGFRSTAASYGRAKATVLEKVVFGDAYTTFLNSTSLSSSTNALTFSTSSSYAIMTLDDIQRNKTATPRNQGHGSQTDKTIAQRNRIAASSTLNSSTVENQEQLGKQKKKD